MYAYIKGKVTLVKPTYVVIENGGIGYLILVANPYFYKLEDEITMYLHHHVREDVFNLYGFINGEQKDLFLKLISVSGIGPKTALSILASGQEHELMRAIQAGDAKFLTKFPGVGTKTAQQIILDLQGKIILSDGTGSEKLQIMEVSEALFALGYTKIAINKVIKRIDQTESTSNMIKQALMLLI